MRQTGAPKSGDGLDFQAIVELAPDALILINSSGRILLVNRQTELLFGHDRADLLGSPVEVLIPERFYSAHVHRRAGYAATPRARAMGSGLQLFGRRKDGGEFPAEVSLSPLDASTTDGKPLIIATVRDLSDLRRSEAAHVALEAANQELRQLLALTDTALSSLALDDLLRELLERARAVMAVDDIAVLLLDESGQELRMRAERGPAEALPRRTRFPIGQGVAGRIAATRAPLIVDDLFTFPVANPPLRERLRSAVGVPLLAGERLLGVLLAGSASLRPFSDQDVRLMELLGERVALAIDRAQLYESALVAHTEAERERARWQAAMDSAPAFVITCDADLRLTYFNPAFERLLGARADLSAPAEERPARFGLFLPDGSGPISSDQAPLTRVLREQRVIHGIELLYRDPSSGEERLVTWDTAPMRAADGSILGAVSIGTDITEQRRLERSVRDHAVQLEAIFEAVTDGIVVTDSEGRTILSNAAFRGYLARIHGTSSSEVLSERTAQSPVLDEQGQPLPMELWPQVRALRGEVVDAANAVRILRRAATGEDIMFNTTAAPLRDAEGAIIGAVSVIHDVTAFKQLERERQEARARELAAIEVSQRLDEFFAIAAHDVRNPVTTVNISVQVLQRRLRRLRAALAAGDTEAQAAAIEMLGHSLDSARAGIQGLIRLIARLFDIAQARAGKLELRLEPCDLTALAGEQVAAQRARQPERVIQLQLPGDQPVIALADADRLGETLTNYLSNALKYSPVDRPVTVRLTVAEGRARVAVRDEGPGLSPKEQALVWEMFHRASGVAPLSAVEEQVGSLGLGLHICKRLVEAHPGGVVGVESEVGAGSTFWFELPLLSDTPGDTPATNASQAPGA
ncbi:MAG TPA: PAS domain S-box protein [Ktedonobacterales bacterium]|nr:PAS domain S-box protein [Ktedonobacterales bacterium]